MRILVQRVKHASVVVDDKTIADIGQGLLLLLGIGNDDGKEDIEWLSKKVSNLRIFDDEQGVMNQSVKDIGGEVIVVSQFTLLANTKKGNRPSYIKAARPEVSVPLYEQFVATLTQELGKEVQCGQFGADMKVTLLNDGPITIWLDTHNKE